MFIPTADHHEILVDDHHGDIVEARRAATLPNVGYSDMDIEKEAYGGYEPQTPMASYQPAAGPYQTPMAPNLMYQIPMNTAPMASGAYNAPLAMSGYPNSANYIPDAGFDNRYPNPRQPAFNYNSQSQMPMN